MKILYYGGQKSGKSRLAEAKALELAQTNRPLYYVATYIRNDNDAEMLSRIQKHRNQRNTRFATLEVPLYLSDAVEDKDGVYLIDCISMWIFNTLHWEESKVLHAIDTLCDTDADLIFVLNDVGSGVIPADAQSRLFVDRSGIVGQKLAARCDEVYEVKLGLPCRLK